MSALLLLVLPASLAAEPASAARNRLTAFVELTYTPGAERHPVGMGVGVEVALAFTQRSRFASPPAVDGNAGAGIRARLHGDGSAVVALEPIIGVITGAPDLLCGPEFPATVSVDVRPGLVFRSRGGPGLSLGGAVTGVFGLFPLRAHASTVLPFGQNAGNPARVSGGTQDGTIAVGTGFSVQTFGCSE